MMDVRQLRIALTVSDFNGALTFYRDVLGLEQSADWSTGDGRVVLLEAGRATLELLDEAQAEVVDQIEAGRRVSGPVRLALEVDDSEVTARRLVAGGCGSRRRAGDDALGRPQRSRSRSRWDAAHALHTRLR
jgi:methylmalonyl-CoA/ethylmalonyl-CoA epimerase